MPEDADRYLMRLQELTGENAAIKVGVLENATAFSKSGKPVRVAEYAMYNEYGTQDIPTRPAFRSTVKEYGDDWADLVGTLILDHGLSGKDALAQVGAEAVDAIQEAIDKWETPPNKPATIKRKRSKRNNPLVDKGAYMDAIAMAPVGAKE